jgi:FAD/FMN-containing dehydrogenase
MDRAPVPAADDVAALRTSLRGRLLAPGDDGYDATRVVWNGMIDRRPAFIVCCAGVADVIESVAFARRHALPLSIRGGGHNVAGYAVCDGGLMIDLSAMRAVRVDPAVRRAWVQGGALWGDVDCETTVFGLATPGGLISQTGVAGLTLSGGFGWLRGTHGLCVDNLEAVDIVTADGRLLHAGADEHADLFWAVRGGGGNFGVVTGFTFRLHPIPPAMMFCGRAYPALFEFRSPHQPPRRIPVSATGYRSHFAPMSAVEAEPSRQEYARLPSWTPARLLAAIFEGLIDATVQAAKRSRRCRPEIGRVGERPSECTALLRAADDQHLSGCGKPNRRKTIRLLPGRNFSHRSMMGGYQK